MSEAVHNPFAGSDLRLKLRKENRVKGFMLLASLVLIVPILVIIAYLIYKASPVLSWDYIWGDPGPLGNSKFIWLPLIGTFYLVVVSLILVAPIGILAGVYLNEYAQIIGLLVQSIWLLPVWLVCHQLFMLFLASDVLC